MEIVFTLGLSGQVSTGKMGKSIPSWRNGVKIRTKLEKIRVDGIQIIQDLECCAQEFALHSVNAEGPVKASKLRSDIALTLVTMYRVISMIQALRKTLHRHPLT